MMYRRDSESSNNKLPVLSDDIRIDKPRNTSREHMNDNPTVFLENTEDNVLEYATTHSFEKKCVTFSSQPGEEDSNILDASDCLKYMRKGSTLTKLRSSGRQIKRTFCLDEQMRCIRWNSSSKRQARAQIHITEIHDAQLGCSNHATHSLRRRRTSSVTPSPNQLTSHPNTLQLPYPGASGSMTLPRNQHHSLSRSSSIAHSAHSLSAGVAGATQQLLLLHPSAALTTAAASAAAATSQQLALTSSTFTISYGPEFEQLELLANSPEEANIWVTGLKCLMSGAQDPEILEQRQLPRDRWLQRVFQETDRTNSGLITEHQIIQLVQSINPDLSENHVRQQLKEYPSRFREHRGHFDREGFVGFFKKLATRPDIYHLLVRYASDAEVLNQDDLLHFLEIEQGQTGVTIDQCATFIDRFEPSAENRQNSVMSIDGFTAFLLSRECDIFNGTHLKVCQDMSQPITHYYLAASHKTFLLKDQLTGPCGVEGYQRALLSGCRYIEIEVYDGYDGCPVVRRINSKPPGLPISLVLETISALAFKRSEYPLIISIDCFASAQQQLALATLLLHYLGPRLLLPTSEFQFDLGESQLEEESENGSGGTMVVERTHSHRASQTHRRHSVTTVNLTNENSVWSADGSRVRWPSPRDLMERILLQGKRLPKGTTGEMGNDRGPNLRRFSHYLQPSFNNIIKELSDLFFFDCASSIGIPASDFGAKNHRGSYFGIRSTSTMAHARTTASRTSTTLQPHTMRLKSSVVLVGTHTDSMPTTAAIPPLDNHSNATGGGGATTVLTAKDRNRVHPYHVVQISESEASKALGGVAGELVQLTRNTLSKVVPSMSRADSSNVNPMDIWAWGGQIVPLNYQTAGVVMDLATGFFARNGACGYVLKPTLYRKLSSFFNPMAEQSIRLHQKPPDTTPQIFRLRILSAQQLPKPRGSVSKGETIEPYVVIELHGIPVDCAEQRTATAPAGNASGSNANFNDTFEFCVQLGSLAVVRFIVLDDHAIGDDFIGQNTIPFDCLLNGYRHVRLRSDTGEPIPQATLFVHVTITNRKIEGEMKQSTGVFQRLRARKRQPVQLKKTGASSFDDLFKTAGTTLQQAVDLRTTLQHTFDQFRQSSGETSGTLSMASCVRALASRLGASCGTPDLWPVRMRIRPEDDMPHLELQTTSPIFGSSLSIYPSLSTLADVGTPLTGRNSIMNRLSPSPGLQRSPSVSLSTRTTFFHRHILKRQANSIDEDSNSGLSIDITSSSSAANNSMGSSSRINRETSPNSVSLVRRPSIQSSTSSISSLSIGGVDKVKRCVTDFEAFVDAAKMVIKQGPYLRVKLQHAQRAALNAYTSFLDNLKEPPGQSVKVCPIRTGITPSDVDSTSVSRITSKESRKSDETRQLSTNGSGSSLYWRKMSRIADLVTWNIRLLTGQAEQMNITIGEVSTWLRQAREASSASGLLVSLSKLDPCLLDETVNKMETSLTLSDAMHDSSNGTKNIRISQSRLRDRSNVPSDAITLPSTLATGTSGRSPSTIHSHSVVYGPGRSISSVSPDYETSLSSTPYSASYSKRPSTSSTLPISPTPLASFPERTNRPTLSNSRLSGSSAYYTSRMRRSTDRYNPAND